MSVLQTPKATLLQLNAFIFYVDPSRKPFRRLENILLGAVKYTSDDLTTRKFQTRYKIPVCEINFQFVVET